jgi:hypothetical protein
MMVLPEFDRLVIHHKHSVYSCSLEALSRVPRTGASGQAGLEKSFQRVTAADENVQLTHVGQVGSRTLRKVMR